MAIYSVRGLILLLVIFSFVSAHNYLVVPTENDKNSCPQHKSWNCTTLEELSLWMKNGSGEHVTLNFLPREYLLLQRLNMAGFTTVKITGKKSQNSSSVINCRGNSGFDFTELQSLDIAFLKLAHCSNIRANGGAIAIVNVPMVRLRCCYFVKNMILNFHGGAIYVNNIVNMTIEESLFEQNSADCSTCRGGAIYAEGGNISLINCVYRNNTAHYGGAVYMRNYGQIFSINTRFTANRADAGGAIILAPLCNIFLYSSQFVRNTAESAGGAVFVSSGNALCVDSLFKNNTAAFGGAINLGGYGNISTVNTQFLSNTAYAGGAISAIRSSIYSNGGQFSNNRAILYNSNKKYNVQIYEIKGGAILVANGSISTFNCQFVNNQASFIGGAIFLRNGSISSENDQYVQNIAFGGGAIFITFGSITTLTCQFVMNMAKGVLYGGGAIFVSSGTVTITDNCIKNNTGIIGAISIGNSGNIYSTGSNYISNSADLFGASLKVGLGSITVFNDTFINNTARTTGGAIYVYTGTVASINSHYTGNKAYHGGAIFFACGSITSNNSVYMNNKANLDGGAIYITRNICNEYPTAATLSITSLNEISNDYFANNIAGRTAAAIFCNNGILKIKQSDFFENSSPQASIIYVSSSSFFIDQLQFRSNKGSLNSFNSRVVFFNGPATFTNNIAYSGGAINSVQSQVYFNTTIFISNNTATYGGGLSLRQSTLRVYHPIEITENTAHTSGGGVYAHQSVIEFVSDPPSAMPQTSNISRNSAFNNGGGIYAIASNLILSRSFVHLRANTAGGNGGAIFLEQSAKIYLYKFDFEVIVPQDNFYKVMLDITSNVAARYGGGIYVSDYSNAGFVCEAVDILAEQSAGLKECFVQTLKLYEDILTHVPTNNYNTFLINNTAILGKDIYGGLVDRCTVNPAAEILTYINYTKQNVSLSNAFDYIKTTVQIEQIVDYHNVNFTKTTSQVLNAISKSRVLGLLSSDAVQVLFCMENSVNFSDRYPTLFKTRGGTLKVYVVAVDQVGNSLEATIVSSVSSQSGISRLKEGQTKQRVGHQCSELEYNVYSLDSSAQIILYAVGPCSNLGVSKQTLNVTFLQCSCPIGFQLSQSKIDCICECDEILKPYQITTCSCENRTIRIETKIWIGTSNTTNVTGYVIQDCPYDYCVEKPVNISLTSQEEQDKQCAYNRTGNLCGECMEGLSLVFASSKCEDCANYSIFLLIPFALAGVLLVVFILLLNFTMATGTLHGLIFYANLLAANCSIFLPFATPNFLTVYISWVNLDVGIETCFYDGMNSQAKVLLQLVFPGYIYFLTILIIILCEYSQYFAAIFAKRNPVATLCTLFLLSYSKLLRVVIAALQYTFLNYLDGSRDIVWLYDANVQYFNVGHIPRFIAAFVIIILGSVYTILLFFGQWLPRCSRMKLMKWTKNTKYNAFLDAYHAPFTPKHRYWIGLLLFAQIVHNLVTAMSTDNVLPVLSVGCIVVGLIMIKLLSGAIYKNKLHDSLETLFLTNLIVLSIATLYVGEANQNQLALANISMALSFILFVGIVCYHSYRYILKARMCIGIGRQRNVRNRHEMYRLAHDVQEPLVNDEEIVDNNNHQEPDSLLESYTGEPREENDQPHEYLTPPLIRPAVRYDQLREPDLDILDPINTDDYMEPAPLAHVYEPPVITYTVIDAIPKTDQVMQLD